MTEEAFDLFEAYIDAKIAFAKMSVKERGDVLDILHYKRKRALAALSSDTQKGQV